MRIEQQSLVDCIELVNNMVKSDGGYISFDSYEPASARVRVRYREGVNEECASCSFSAEFVRAFLLDSFTTHGHDIAEVVVADDLG